MLVFRPDTDDREFWEAARRLDEYETPVFVGEDVVLDLGANIGSFTYRAHERGSREIWAFEACPENAALARCNVGGLPGVQVFNTAVVAPGRPRSLPFPSGCNSFYIPLHPPVCVQTRTLDEIVRMIGDPVRFLKIDIEGSEWEVLYTFEAFDRVQEIRGEYHQPSPTWFDLKQTEGLPAFNWVALEAFLQSKGYQTEFVAPTPPPMSGGFHAWRP